MYICFNGCTFKSYTYVLKLFFIRCATYHSAVKISQSCTCDDIPSDVTI